MEWNDGFLGEYALVNFWDKKGAIIPGSPAGVFEALAARGAAMTKQEIAGALERSFTTIESDLGALRTLGLIHQLKWVGADTYFISEFVKAAKEPVLEILKTLPVKVKVRSQEIQNIRFRVFEALAKEIFGESLSPNKESMGLLYRYLHYIDEQRRGYHDRIIQRFRDDEGNHTIAFDNLTARYTKILSHLLTHLDSLEGNRILEIGPGPGNMVNLLKQWGFDAWGLEPSEAFVNFAQEHKLNMVLGDLIDPPADLFDNPFDVTFSHWVLDALYSPQGQGPATRMDEYQALINLSRLTKQGGLSIQEVDPSLGLPFTTEDFALAGFEVIIKENSMLVVLQKVREPVPIEKFQELMHRNKEEQGRMGNARIALWITTSFDPTLRDIVDATNESEYVYDDEPLTIDRLLQWVSNNPLLAELYASEKPSLEFRKWKALWGIIEKPESPLLVNPLPLLKEVPDLESFVRRVLTKRYTSWGLPDDL